MSNNDEYKDYVNRNLKRFPPRIASETRPKSIEATPEYDGRMAYYKSQPPTFTEFVNQEVPSAVSMVESSLEQFVSETGIDLDSKVDHNGNYNHSYVEWLESKLR